LFHYTAYARCQNHLITYILLDLTVECHRLTLQKKMSCVRFFAASLLGIKICDPGAYLLSEGVLAMWVGDENSLNEVQVFRLEFPNL